ncbi:glutamate synthase, NADH/NADPH, small subunit [Segniliparus rotundus DSM 44985]|uniref:Glutamate synthase, NADH/NADPH, small subunit n=1 Tax=Segniliparus rotundus (strain ATCC BAA-972 / CDC 1076 / CIP 108378 / DSM 44985 / JCM 13578) TaxID=640132 RepID=D6ZBP5_SEGRD|nr:glutamate synthase subunit beta [Segniliparus rotundus]ADG96872.1 glutamate synthase, NADH/NADPH, small subunit [Segniliparus rotundus DSM 44985]
MPDPSGFLKHTMAQLPARRPVPLRLRDWNEVYQEFDETTLRNQASRCMDCGIPFCHQGCPLGNLIPDWNDLSRTGQWRDAIERLHATNNFPEFTGRLCPAPCESACVLGINQDPVTIKQIEVEIIDRAFEEGWVPPVHPHQLTGKRVAVVGSGPAGLAAAQQLTRAGHMVTVFERDERIGGLLRYGIPDFKMEKRHIDRRLVQMEAEGTIFRVGVNVGVDVTVEKLRASYNAVVLAVGALEPRELDVPGRDLDGVVQAMDYLPEANRALYEGRAARIDARGKRVVIIGGGDTGADCLGTALRQGAASVHQFDINPEPPKSRDETMPWPTYPRVLRSSAAHQEGGERVFAANTIEFIGRDGALVGLKAHEDVRREGRSIVSVGGEFTQEADLVLLALGFTGPQRPDLLDKLGVELTERGDVKRDENYQTSVEGVFVAGDGGRGQSLIVWAIAEGRAAAAAVDEWLEGETALPRPIAPHAQPLG